MTKRLLTLPLVLALTLFVCSTSVFADGAKGEALGLEDFGDVEQQRLQELGH